MPVIYRRDRFRQGQTFGRPFRLNKHSPQARGLVGWWPTLGGGGNVLRDRSGRGNDGAFPGGTADPTWTRDAERGLVVDYDGAGLWHRHPS